MLPWFVVRRVLRSARDALKAHLQDANRIVLSYQQQADECSRRAAAFQKALDALDGNIESFTEESKPPSQPKGATRNRIIDLLREKGSLSGQAIAALLGISYSNVITNLTRGPFRSVKNREDNRLKSWHLDEDKIPPLPTQAAVNTEENPPFPHPEPTS